MNSELSAFRIATQRISCNEFRDPEDVLSWLGAIQGQDYEGAKWSIGLRLKGSTNRDIELAFRNRSIVRTWLMRGTLHIVSAADIRWMNNLLAQRIIHGTAGRNRELELDENTLLRSGEIMVRALQDHEPINRRDLLSILEQNGISTQGQRASHLLQRASLDGLICQSNITNKNPDFILMESLNSGHRIMQRDEALSELAVRYFTSRGPATLQDFIWWSGLPATEAKIGIEGSKNRLVETTIEGVTYWQGKQDIPLNNFPLIHILPGFDEILLGYKNRSFTLDPQFTNRWCPGNNGMFLPFCLVDNQVLGNWKGIIRNNKISIEIFPFVPWKKTQMTEISKAVEPYCKFKEIPLHEVNVS